jgi:hypothetical protein
MGFTTIFEAPGLSPAARRRARAAGPRAVAMRSTITALLRLVEETLPIGLIRAVHASEAEREPEPFEGATPEEVLVVARQIFEATHSDSPWSSVSTAL